MDFYLVLNQGERLDVEGTAPLEQRLATNWDRSLFAPAPGCRLYRLRPRTNNEQGALEHALANLVRGEGPYGPCQE